MSQVYSDWLEAFSRYTKALGRRIQRRRLMIHDYFLGWKCIGMLCRQRENWPLFVKQAELTSVD